MDEDFSISVSRGATTGKTFSLHVTILGHVSEVPFRCQVIPQKDDSNGKEIPGVFRITGSIVIDDPEMLKQLVDLNLRNGDKYINKITIKIMMTYEIVCG